GRAAAAAELGQHGGRRATVPRVGVVDRHLSRARHLRHRARLQSLRGRTAGCVRSRALFRVVVIAKGGVTVIHAILFAVLVVALSFYSVLDPKVTTPHRAYFDALVGFPELTAKENPKRPEDLAVRPIEVVDDHTVRFRLRYPSGSFLAVLVNPRAGIVPEHLLNDADLNTAEFNRKPVGTGPFKFV